MKKFLSVLGSIVTTGLAIFTGFRPVIDSNLPGAQGITQTISKDFTEVANIVAEVEQIGQALALPGPQKLIAAAGPVAQVILQSTVFAGHPIADQALFNKGASEIASGMADCLNSLHQDVAKSMTAPVKTS